MDKEFIFSFISKHKDAVLATVNNSQLPEAAIVGIAVTPGLQLIFDTLPSTRKYSNLLANPAIAFVIGSNEQTMQYEGTARIPTAIELEGIKEQYFKTFPDGVSRQAWPGITYFLVEPRWIRYSDYQKEPPNIEEIKFPS